MYEGTRREHGNVISTRTVYEHHGRTLELAHPGEAWAPVLSPGLTLLSGNKRELTSFHQELTHHVVHTEPGHVLWCDASHAFDPYAFAERNLVAGYQADHGAERVLIKRCMTPFQWDSVLTQHLDEKLLHTDAALVIAAPFDRLFSTDELSDWEQEDYVRYALRHLRSLARSHRVPILVSVDMARWWHTHPGLASMAFSSVHRRWQVTRPDGRFRAVCEELGLMVDPEIRRRVTLLDFMEERAVPPTPVARGRAPGLADPIPLLAARVADAPDLAAYA